MTDSVKSQKTASYAHFEKTRREAVRIQRRQGILFGALFLGAFLGSLWIAEVSAESWPRGSRKFSATSDVPFPPSIGEL